MVKLRKAVKKTFRGTMCTSKMRFISEDHALGQVERVWNGRGVKARPYLCPYCNQWHITTKKKRT